jgi:type IV pilus assembly protein PilY1
MIRRFRRFISGAMVFLMVHANAYAAATDLATAPLVTSPSASIQPNLLFAFDDSGSMAWFHLPDDSADAGSSVPWQYGWFGGRSSQCNGMYYNPAIVYKPPVDSTGASYPNATFTAAWNDGHAAAYFTTPFSTSSGVTDLTTGFKGIPSGDSGAITADSSGVNAYYYKYLGGQTQAQKNYNSTTSTFYTECSSNRGASSPPTTIPTGTLAAGGTNGLWIKANVGATTTTTLAITSYSHVTVAGSCTVTVTVPSGTTTGLATGTQLTIAGLNNTNFNGTFAVLATGLTTTAFQYTAANCSGTAPSGGGTFTWTVSNTDERQNFANWYSFYRSRILMMKTAMGLALQPIGSQYRVGFLPMNQSSETVPIDTFDATQKATFYQNLYQKTVGSSTPSLTTVSNAGKYFAHKLTSYGGVSLPDPMQYSCQQNFTIFSTDGFWNSGSATKLDGTAVGNADGAEPRPFNDGSNTVVTTVTPSTVTVRQQSVQNKTTNTPWTKTTTSVSATMNCSATPASSGRSGGGSCLQDDGTNSIGSVRTWCMSVDPSPPQSNDCNGPIGSGNPQVYACRGIFNATNVPNAPDNVGCQYDGSGQAWCIFNGNQFGYSCARVYPGNPLRYCKAAIAGVPNTGYTVTTTPKTYTQVQTGATTTIQDVATTTNTTVVTTNGVDAPPTTSSGGSTTTVVGTPTTTIATDTGAPTGGTTFTSGSATTACMATPPIPAGTSSTSTEVAGTSTTTNSGSASVTTISTSAAVVGTATSTASASGGTSNTLADVAEYYYTTDLRTTTLGNCTGSPVPPASTGLDVCTNNVPVSGQDTASWQHMTFFGLTLGARGQMLYSATYLTDKTGDYFSVLQGQTANTAGGICSWQANGTTCNWPVPGVSSGNGFLANVDDTWHASVNGRGQYFSATDPSTLTLGLQTALAGVKTRTGSSAAATTSNPNVTSGDNFVFSSTFTTTQWDGQLQRQQLDLNTGAVSSTVDWTAQAQLDSNASRVVWTFDSASATTKLKSFAYANLTSSEKGYFDSANIASLSQFCTPAGGTCLTAADQASAAGTPLVSYLAGDRTHEGVLADPTAWYRQRIHLLGDIVDAEAVYVKAPLLNYSDAGFSGSGGYATTTGATRQGMVYVAANDGMLHAFNSSTGAEAWTFVPTLVFPNLYKLADKNYGTSAAQPHQYYTDGTPIAGDVYFGGAWHTIVVAGLGGGGKGYYALDVTDPANPKALWEFTDTNMGYTYGNPVISKLKDCVPATPATCTNGSGTWAVFLTSGYNNNASGQDGDGHLYVVNAGTGALIRDIATNGVGTTTTPSGLARINAWVDNTAVDNTTLRVYGGDLLGNMWRFDVNNIYGAAGYDAQKLVTVYANSAGTVPQPITVKPEIGLVNNTPIVYFGTGRFLGLTDLADTTQQSFYAVQDKLNATTLVTPRATSPTASGFVQQTLTIGTCPANSPPTICGAGQIVRTSTSNPVSFPTDNGWFVDLPDSGERDNTDPTLALGTLGFTTNVPATSACTAGGTSFRYLLDYATGAPVSTSTTHVSAIQLGSALATRAVFVRLPNNTVVQLTRMSDGTTLTTNVPIGGSASNLRRVSWRELITDQ